MDNSGTIDYGEFVAATIHLNKLEREEHLVAAFQYFDKDGSGYITVDELQQACTDHNMTDLFVEDIIKEVDQDNVTFKLFIFKIGQIPLKTSILAVFSHKSPLASFQTLNFLHMLNMNNL